MLKRFLATAAAMAASSIALAQGVATVDLLDPGDGAAFTGMPAGARAVDIFIDVATTDVWTAGGIRAVTENGATLVYFDGDPNTPGSQPGLFNGGAANKFTTMLSKPRGRDGAARFTNAGAAPAGAYDPAGASPVTLAGELNVAYFASPPETPGSLSADGYIARVVINKPAGSSDNYADWGAGPLASIPAGATVVLRSVGSPGGQAGGTATATFDVPQLNFTSWAMWYVPEPTSLALLALGGLAALRRR